MEQSFKIIYPILIFLPFMLSGLAFYKSIKYKNKEFRHLSEFFLSITVVTLSSWFLIPMGSAYIVLSMLSWMWPLRTIGLISEDISRQHLFSKLHYYVLSLGGIISIIFLSFDFTLEMVSAPFSLSVSFIGFTFVFQAYSKRRLVSYGLLQHLNFFLIFAFFLSRLAFPLTSMSYLPIIIDSYLLISFCATLYPLYAEIIFESQEHLLEKVLATRNKQLLTHSGFSEYKILSAGLSHEINNALTIINAKVIQLMKRKVEVPEKDLLIIQQATNRIINSIQSLREFIYPHEVQEILDLDEVVKEVLALYGQRLINHSVQVKIDNLKGKLVSGHKLQLEQVFLSLINNSVEAIDKLEDKWISISAKGNDGQVIINYQDSGPSTAHQIAPLLSDPFYAYNEFMDTDIRLVLAKDIIEQHKGTLNCVQNNEFSAFTMTLPRADALTSTSNNLQKRIEDIKELH